MLVTPVVGKIEKLEGQTAFDQKDQNQLDFAPTNSKPIYMHD